MAISSIENKVIIRGEKLSARLKKVAQEADRYMKIILSVYFFAAAILSFFHNTWMLGLGVSSISLIFLYLVRVLFPRSDIYQYGISIILGLFAALFIYQSHGMPIMHFWYAIGGVLLIFYQKWKLHIPYLLFALAHHLFFSYFHSLRIAEFYYSPLPFTNWLSVGIHAILLFLVIGTCAFIAYLRYQQTFETYDNRQSFVRQLKNVEKSIQFAEKIREGKLNEEYQPDANDRLGNALLEMRKSLQVAAEREEQEKFITRGIAELGEVLRGQESLRDLSHKFIGKLVEYIGMSMGGLFILEGDDTMSPHLELMACYAYGKKKYMEKKVERGIGLLGQLILEKETKYLTDIPVGYANITSGMGEAAPKSMLLVPLINNEQFVGALELASFHPVEEYKKMLIERVAETLAGAILNVRNNEQTRDLLQKSQQMTEKMKNQEKQLISNMEKVQSTQEATVEKEIKMKERILSLEAELRKYTGEEADGFM